MFRIREKGPKSVPYLLFGQFLLLSSLHRYIYPVSGHIRINDNEISDADKPIPIINVEGVLGSRGILPCDVSVPKRDDKLHMVLWFRDRDGEPLYRYDVRDRQPNDAKRWSELGDRLYFQTIMEPAHLSIQNLRLEDEGIFRCRVDFLNSPTRNLRVNLSVIVPSEKPVIYDENGTPISGQIGPYNEGSSLRLTCEVSGGKPKPKASWWLENEMLQDSSVQRGDGIVVNRLEFKPLLRSHLNQRFLCLASNTNQSIPQSAVAVLNLNLRPLSAVILNKDTQLSVDKSYEVECESVGSRPAPTITFWKNNRQVKKHPFIPPTDDKNITKSILTFTPTMDDDTKVLICRSENSWIGSVSAVEDRWKLNVHYPPKVSLQLGPNLNPDDIKSGDGVYFECSVKSNPHYFAMKWFHNGRELRHNTTQRIIMSNNRLILQQITRYAAGDYICSAVNSEGTTQSNAVSLRVKFVPSCKSDSDELIGAMIHETVTIQCEMAADPPTVQFYWTFEHTGVKVMPIEQSRFKSNGTVSWLSYTPTSEHEYGYINCWGSNKIGKGTEGPCRFQLISAGRPYPPKNCSMFNMTEDSLSIICEEGFSGGLEQHFILEVVDSQAKKISKAFSSKTPLFSLEGMVPGVPYMFLIYSINDKGRSDQPFVLDGITFRGVAKYTGKGSTANAEVSPFFAILVGTSIVLIILLVVAIFAIWRRSRRRKPPIVAKPYGRNNENNFSPDGTPLTKIDQNGGGLNGVGVATNGLEAADVENNSDNPDVIPNKNGIQRFIRIHKTPPARRRKKDVEVKNNGETVALTAGTPPQELVELHNNQHKNHNNHHKNHTNHRILVPTNPVIPNNLPPPRESRI